MQKLSKIHTDKELLELLTTDDREIIDDLHNRARAITNKIYGNRIYIRGLIEYSNYCKQSCFYCGINAKNCDIERFRLTKEDILSACKKGYDNGFRTFVLQGGEDPYYDDELFQEIIRDIKSSYPDCAVTLSLGVRSKNSYKLLKEAGAERYLLRFESADEDVFSMLHPKNQSLSRRLEALEDLKECGYITGTGFLIGGPGSSVKSHIEDIKLIRKIQPDMIGVGPFIAHEKTIFKNEESGSVDLTLRILSILRLENPYALIPSTTALNTIDENGRILGILSGANVLMPNLSPDFAKDNYKLYDNKQRKGLESGDGLTDLKILLENYGYQIEIGRGDNKYDTNNKL